MPYKYQLHYDQIPESEAFLNSLNSYDGVLFRWAHSPMDGDNTFTPRFITDPERVNDYETVTEKCNGYAISMYNSLDRAIASLTRHLTRKPNLVQVFGNSIASVNINNECGNCDDASNGGHINLHEHEGVSLVEFANIVHTLPFEYTEE